jgi:carbonic anhydrase
MSAFNWTQRRYPTSVATNNLPKSFYRNREARQRVRWQRSARHLMGTGNFMTGFRIGALLAIALIGSSAYAQEGSHWSYSGDSGPAKWGDLPGYGICKSGQKQSPIDLGAPGATQSMPKLGRYAFYISRDPIGNYPGPLLVHNNGHTIRVVFRGRLPGASPGRFPPSWFTYDGVEYDLRELHFHAPGEHQFNATPYPLEMHMVHQEWKDVASGYDGGKRLVIAVLFKVGEANWELERLLKNLPASGKYIPEPNSRAVIEPGLYFHNMLPRIGGQHEDADSFNKASYRYSGSLTTPGCAEGISWIVLSTPVTASADQIRRLAAVMPANNARPLQNLFGRAISPP